MVGGQIGLTLGAVNQHGINGFAGLELDISGEGSAAHADDALLLDNLHNLVGGQLLQGLAGHDGLVKLVLFIILDDHAQHAGPLIGMGVGSNLHHRAADAGMDGSADKASLLTDDLTHLDMVTRLDNGGGGSADVHGKGNHHGVGFGELHQRQMLGKFLVLHGMNAAVEALIALGASFGNISLDFFHIDLGVVPELNLLIQELLGTTLFGKTLIDFRPGAVLLGVDFALAILGTAALTVHQALGAVHNGADAAGDVQIALGASAAGLLGQRHAMMTGVVQGVGCGKGRNGSKIRYRLHAQAAGDDHYILGSLGNQRSQLLLGLHLVAQEADLGSTGNGFAQRGGKGCHLLNLRLLHGVELFEALVARYQEQVVLPGQQRSKLLARL